MKIDFDLSIILGVLVSFAIANIIGPFVIRYLKILNFGQIERKLGPKSHKKKEGTPTIGGIIFMIAILITTLIFVRRFSNEAMICMYSLLVFGVIGFLDDILKIFKKDNEGLTSKQKMILLIIVSGFFAGYTYYAFGSEIYIPIAKVKHDLGWFYIPFIMFFYIAVTNATNFTDGLDGLLTSVTLIVVSFLCLVAFGLAYHTLAIFCGIIIGGLLGFLRFNNFPARVIMGDTGSLAIGGVICTICIVMQLPLIVIIIGGIYVIESLSVVIQILYYKKTKKRVFKMAPIHHHFELSGWSETKVVMIFSMTTVILCLIAFLTL